MNQILLVDDNEIRGNKIKQFLINEHFFLEEQIDFVDCVKLAEINLKQTNYALAFIDMSLPYNQDDKADPFSGINILKKISSKRLNQPIRIIGYTALDDDIVKKEQEFEYLGFKLYHAQEHDLSWLGRIKGQIDYAVQSSEMYKTSDVDMALVTIHGIQTFGNWQEELSNEIKKHNSSLLFSHLPFKNSLISFNTFLRPKKREKVIELFRQNLHSWLEKNRVKRIVFFSHSFGTYVLIKAIERIDNPELLKNISLIVLSGSVLPRDYNFDKILRLTPAIIINECAVKDSALLLSEIASVGTGMGGKLGFNILSTDRIKNRFYNFGHSGFFKGDFVKKYWFPLLDTPPIILEVNESKPINILNSPVTYFAMFIGKFKNKLFK